MKDGEVLSIASWGTRITGSSGSYASTVMCYIGSYAQCLTGVDGNSISQYNNSWPTPYLFNITSATTTNNREGTGALPIAAPTVQPNLRIGLEYVTYNMEFSNNTTCTSVVELFVMLCRQDTDDSPITCIEDSDQNFGGGSALAVAPNAGSYSSGRVYGFPTHYHLGTKVTDWPYLRKTWKILKKVSFVLPAASNSEHNFSIRYNQIFDNDNLTSSFKNYIGGKTLAFYVRVKGEVVVDKTTSGENPANIITTGSTDVSVAITGRKHFKLPEDPLQPRMKFLSSAMPQGVNSEAIVNDGTAIDLIENLFD